MAINVKQLFAFISLLIKYYNIFVFVCTFQIFSLLLHSYSALFQEIYGLKALV